jgi:hypothetical protein|tara:strand:+ start:200 stop:2128 length:1929 start_codon:yes stop_codon:yes gene_type:complete
MAFQVSPGVLVQERDLTNVIPAVATTIGAVAGQFSQGPMDEVTSISSEKELVETFGKPDSTTFEYFFSAASFLQYSSSLRVVRTANSGSKNAVVSGTALQIKNTDHYQNGDGTTGPYNTGSANVGEWAARTAGAWGNSLSVSVCPSAAAYEMAAKTTVDDASTAVGDTTIVLASGSDFAVGDIVNFAEAGGHEYRVTAVNSATLTFVRHPSGTGGLHTAVANGAAVRRRWRYYDLVDVAPGTSTYTSSRSGSGDELHIVVIDEDGGITGNAGEVLEVYSNVSKASDAKTSQGDSNYYADVIYNKSQYIYWMDHVATGSNWGSTATGTTFTALSLPFTRSLISGADGSAASNAELKTAYEKYADGDTVDVNLIIAGAGDATHIDNLITIAENRKDAVVFASPERSDVVNVTNSTTQTSNVKGFFDGIRSSSYIVFDSGYKYTYDKYNDVFRYVPLNGDTAGLAARTDLIADSWFSPAGFNRGVLRGVVKLAYNPNKTQRDELYRARVNPVVTMPGQGTILFGDKTGLSTPSAFDRINVRRLFITLEKAISTASKFQLFEFNDEFTRAQFRNIVEPFLRDVQGRRGITDFSVVCDETNNSPDLVVDRNEFRADIFVKPNRSINFITLQFVATRSGVAFEEVVGG